MSYIAARTAATAATIDHCVGALWNPHATKDILVYGVELVSTAATACQPGLGRISARGTAGSSVTSAIQHDADYGVAPSSGAILDLSAYSAQPTLIGAGTARWLKKWSFAAVIGAGIMWQFRKPIRIPPGAGLGIFTTTAIAFPVSDIGFEWDEYL